MSALDIQVGGSHYREGGIQPVQYIEANSLQFLEASVVKRVTRHNRPTGKGRQDIEKAIHELQLLLELRYAEVAAPAAASQTWILHDGQTQPLIQKGARAELKHRDGSVSEVKSVDYEASHWQWYGEPQRITDIVAYRPA